MQLSDEGKQLLVLAARELGLDVAAQLSEFEHFYELLTEANQTTNLTAIRDESGIVIKHFVDSLTCLKYPRLHNTLKVIDLGTGAGFPGLPLALVQPDLKIDLLDSTKKKVDFVDFVIHNLELGNAKGIWARAEDLGQEIVKRETYDAVVTRAVASLTVLAELSLPLVRVGGFVLVQKSISVDQEIQDAKNAIKKLGGRIEETISLELPISKDKRNLVIIEKIAPTPKQYPRKAGVPAKNPLS